MGSCTSSDVQAGLEITSDIISLLPGIMEKVPLNDEQRYKKLSHYQAIKKELKGYNKELLKYVVKHCDGVEGMPLDPPKLIRQ